MKFIFLSFICLTLSIANGQGVHIDLTNTDGTLSYRHFGLIPNQTQNGAVQFGFLGPNDDDAVFFELNADLSQVWAKKIENGQNDMFAGEWIAAHLGDQKFLKVNFATYSPNIGNSLPMSLGFAQYDGFEHIEGTTKYYENTFFANNFFANSLYPVIRNHKKITENTFLVSGNVFRDVNGFSGSSFPHLLKMDTLGNILWSKVYVAQDNDYLAIKQVEKINDHQAYVLGKYYTQTATLTSTDKFFVGMLDLDDGTLNQVNIFDAVGDYWGGGFFRSSIKVMNGSIYLTGSVIYLGNSPVSEFFNGSFICKLNNDLQTIDWFVNYNGAIVDFVFEEQTNTLVGIFENVVLNPNHTEIIDFYYRLCEIDLANEGAVVLNKELEGDINYEYNYIYGTDENYTLGFSDFQGNDEHHHILTINKDDLTGCDMSNDMIDINIVTDDIVIGKIDSVVFSTLDDLFLNNTLSYSPTLGTVTDENLDPDILCVVSGADDLIDSNDILLYPNPTDGILHIENNLLSNVAFLSVYNALGQKVFQKDAPVQINLKTLEAGVYFVHLETENGSIVQPIVKR